MLFSQCNLVLRQLLNLGQIGFMGYCTMCLLSKYLSPVLEHLKLTTIVLRYGGGLHQWDVPDHLITQYNQVRLFLLP